MAVHGLNGHREKTFTTEKINWLRHFLPNDIPNVRILSYGYNSRTYGSRFSIHKLDDHAAGLLGALHFWRKHDGVT